MTRIWKGRVTVRIARGRIKKQKLVDKDTGNLNMRRIYNLCWFEHDA